MQLTHLGPYEINQPLGKGGMGSVYAATHTQTGQRVAIKALSPHLASAEGFRERFEAEIESLKTLRHDGIVRLYGYGEQDGMLFYAMELVEGISLEDELKAGRRFNWREVTNIAIQLSLALKHAHDHGIVHRDIKPANILLHVAAGGPPARGQASRLSLQDDERVKLADFGIARLFGTTSLTTAGGVLGTADYMSPEQADGRPVTARCDQYSLGGVMYALLAGRPPFRAKNLPQMLQLQRFAEPEPVRRYAPDTPEQLEHVIMQLLAKDPTDRFPNTQVLARHLQALAMALTRPAADDFALATDQPGGERHNADLHSSLSIKVTQAEAVLGNPESVDASVESVGRISRLPASQDAATMAADESLLKQISRGVPATNPTAPAAPTPPVIERPTRFTTLEEDELLRRSQQQRSWLVVAGQLAGFAAVLAALGSLAMYLSRPPSADKLYSSIATRVDGDDDASLGKVETEVHEFLDRYPDDPRASVLRSYKERIELDKLERKLQWQTRGIGQQPAGKSLLPAEQLYLRATNLAVSAPDDSLAMLESLVDLYGPESNANSEAVAQTTTGKKHSDRDASDRTAEVVQLAKRRLETLRADLARQREQQLATLDERMAVAERLSATNPQQAAAMYRAILNLHHSDAWAGKVMDKARSRLAELEKTK